MGNLFSNLLGETSASAPAASYTVTPASSSNSTTTTSSSQNSTTATTSNSNQGEVCSPGTNTKTSSTFLQQVPLYKLAIANFQNL